MASLGVQTPAHKLYPEFGGDAQPPAGMPSLDVDVFSDEVLADPYKVHAAIRDLGPVVWLSRYGVAAIARHAQVRQALGDWETFSSARGVGLTDYARHPRFRPPSLLLEADPPAHSRPRTVLMRALSPRVMRNLRERFVREADDLVDELVERGSFDGWTDLAQAFPLRVFPDAIGMTREGRENLLPIGDLAFNSFGPPNARFQACEPLARAAFPWLETYAGREHLASDGFGETCYQAADAGEITADDARSLVRAMLGAGVDTTVSGIGAALFALARFPDQWVRLRQNPKLAAAAFEEAIRFESPVQTFFRTTTRVAELGGVPLGEGEKVLMFLGAANRDPRHWDNPDAYDIERRAVGHVGFGGGVHMCVGQLLARLEGEVILDAMARKVGEIAIIGEPVRRLNNTLRGLSSLPLRFTAA